MGFFERAWMMYKLRLVLGVVFLFFVSMAMSCQELRYSVWGKTVDASVTRDQVETITGRSGSTHPKRSVWYSFRDQEKLREEYAEVPIDAPPFQGSTVKVQYIAGREMQSRLLGQHHWGWVVVFLLSLVGGVVGIWAIARED